MHTLIIGFDSFDPITFEKLSSQGKMPHLSKYVDSGNYARFTVSDPPQTEVSWSSISSGLDPGGHGVFDFVHRNPKSYSPYVSLLPTEQTAFGTQFIPPVKAHTIFEEAANKGYPATTLWWPATFPAQPGSPVRTIPGLGTPDILGRLGVGSFFTTDCALLDKSGKTPVKILEKKSNGVYCSALDGPLQKKKNSAQETSLEFFLEIEDQKDAAKLRIGKQEILLAKGQWSQVIEVTFKMGMFFSVRSITRAILVETKKNISIYFLPLQIHPTASVWRYATPPSFIKQTWKNTGPFLSLGWPQDTTALEEGLISDSQFLDLCDSIFSNRERIFMHHLESFQEGLFGIVFDSLDRIQHMFRRDQKDIVENWYQKLDSFIGRVENKISDLDYQKIKLLVLSDHGFADFNYKVNLNDWLIQNNFLTVNDSMNAGNLKNADWKKSQAYAIGLNSLYINLKNREGQGSVNAEQYPTIVEKIRNQLEDWKGPDGNNVVQRALFKDDIYSGPYKDFGPDILVGYSPAYRASSETGLGEYKLTDIENNHDHWGADHCIDSLSVPGVILSNQDIKNFPSPSFRDIPILTTGKELEASNKQPPSPPSSSEEDQEIIEERLKSLGYL